MVKIKLRVSAAVEYENVVYFSPIYINGLFKLDLETEKVSFLCRFEEKAVNYALHRIAYIYNNEIWFIPYQASKIAVVNLRTLEIEYISPLYHNMVNAGVKLRGGMLYCKGEIIKEKFLCLIPSSIDTVLMINMETKELTPFYNVIGPEELLDGGAYDPVQDCIWMQFTKGKDGILKLDLKDGKTERYGHSFNDNNYGMYYYQDDLFMAPGEDNSIKIINTKNLQVTSYPIEKENAKERYFWITSYKDEIWFLPIDEPRIMVWDKINRKIKTKQLVGNFDNSVPFAIASIPSSKKMIFTTEYANCIYIYNDTNFIEKIEVEWLRKNVSNEEERNIFDLELKKMGRNGIYFENRRCISLNVFIDSIDILNETKKAQEIKGLNIYCNTNA